LKTDIVLVELIFGVDTMLAKMFLILMAATTISACVSGGGSGGTAGSGQINSSDYTLPGAIPSVPDQAR
jgi:hypothetical protein